MTIPRGGQREGVFCFLILNHDGQEEEQAGECVLAAVVDGAGLTRADYPAVVLVL